ncbi:alpha/beta hydrolase, partial [Streptomyces sp. NPDC127044]
MRAKRPTRRLTAFASAGALVTATLIAGAVAAPSATADSRHGQGYGQSREQRGAAVAAERAAKAGIDWQDCPADWGFEKP